MREASVAGTEAERRGWARRLMRDCWQYKKDVLLALGASLAGMAVMALVPLVPKLIIDDVIVKHDRPLAPWATLLVVAASTAAGWHSTPSTICARGCSPPSPGSTADGRTS